MAHLTSARWRRRIVSLTLLVMGWCTMTGGVFSGCKGLFTPATPEPPSGQPIVPHYESVESTLRTMKLGLAAKNGQGASAWTGAFDETGYHQDFDPRDLAFYESSCQCEAAKDWGFAEEQQFYRSFIEVRPSDDYLATFDPMPENPDDEPGSTHALIHRHYQVLANSPGGNATTIIAIGSADLTFDLKDGKWLITRWGDRVDSTVAGTVNPNDPWQLTLGRRRLESTTR
jgi:hypothetical protein